jgi:hypothetical protein
MLIRTCIGLVVCSSGASLLASTAESPPSKQRVAIEMMASGFGAAELASIGCSDTTAETVLNAARADSELFDDLAQLDASLAAIDVQIREANRLLRISLIEHADQRSVLLNAKAQRTSIITQIRVARSDLRSIVCEAVPGSEPVEARIAATDAVSKSIPAPWRANDVTDARRHRIAWALAESHRASRTGESTPPDAALVIAEEQAGGHTTLALTRHNQNSAAVQGVITAWITAD